MRINRYEELVENAKAFGLDPSGLSDYLSIFRYGCPPHGGFAIGLERLTQKVMGLASVKEATLFPRDRKRTRP
jgi:nondiscriminating aspartyl-tRNA synthetase